MAEAQGEPVSRGITFQEYVVRKEMSRSTLDQLQDNLQALVEINNRIKSLKSSLKSSQLTEQICKPELVGGKR